MIWIAFIVLLVLWLVGTIFNTVGPAINILLILAMILLAANLVRQRTVS